MKGKKTESGPVEIPLVTMKRISVYLKGTTPIIINRLPEKARQVLLAGGVRKNQAEKAITMKHDPLEEFRSAAHVLQDGPTYLGFPASGVKKAIASAALELPGLTKASLNRNIRVSSEYVPIYGIPQIYTCAVRPPNQAPDIRTRVIVPEWLTVIQVEFPAPKLTAEGIVNLLAAAGLFIGLGDNRQEKGTASFGCFEPVNADAAAVKQLLKCGRAVQKKAMEDAKPYNDETAELLGWLDVEAKRRGMRIAS